MNEHMTVEMSVPAQAAAAAVHQTPRRKMSVRWAVGVLAIVLVLAIAGVYWMTSATPATSYVTAPVTKGAVTRVVAGSGSVNPVLTVIVGTYVSGAIQSVTCDFNTKVKKGQLCAKIDPRPYQTLVTQAAANLANAKAQLVKDQANLAYGQESYDRNTKLLAIGGASQDTVDIAKNALDQAKAQILLDQATIQQHEAELEAANVNLDYTNIVSPVDGTVVSRNVTVGQTVAASFQTPTLFLIATDLTKMEVDTNVSESDIGAVRTGDKATFTVEAYPEKIFQGVVTQVRQAPQTVQNVVTYDVIIAVDNPDQLLKPGMTATTRIVTAARDNVLRVSDQALRFSPGGQTRAAAGAQSLPPGQGRVWVMKDGQLQAVALKLGLDDDTYSEIADGALKSGDAVVIGGQAAGTAANSVTARPRFFGF